MNLNATSKLTTIEVNNLQIDTPSGPVCISYSFQYNAARASQSDKLQHAVDYVALNKKISTLLHNQSFRLLEHAADKVYTHILTTSPLIEQIEVTTVRTPCHAAGEQMQVRISSAQRHNTAMIALGSNIDAERNFELALTHIARLGIITRRTEFIVTPPYKYESQADFLNGALLLVTPLGMSHLTLQLKQIETLLGRTRNGTRFTPRTIDLDIITFNGFVVDEEIEELPFLKDFLGYLQPEVEMR